MMASEQQHGADAAAAIIAGFGRFLTAADAAAAEREQREDEQQDRRAPAGSRGISWISARLRSRVSRAFGGLGRGGRLARALLGWRRAPGPGAAGRSCETHSVVDRLEGLARLAEEGGELAIGDREGEGRVAVLVAGDQGVDAEHAAALVEQGPARMAAGDVGGVQAGW